MYGFEFIPEKGRSEEDINLLVKVSTAPVIPLPQEYVRNIQYGDGTVEYEHTGIYSDRVISLSCNFVEKSKRAWVDNVSKIRKYFGCCYGRLRLISDDLEHYFKVKHVDISVDNRKLGRIGELTISFYTDPYRYFLKYQEPLRQVSGDVLTFNNPFEPATPVIRIRNTSVDAELITIKNNGKIFKIEKPFTPVMIGEEMDDWGINYIEIDVANAWLKRVGNSADFDTGYRITYDTIKTSGSFDDLVLATGENKFELTIDKGSVAYDVFRNYREI